MPRFIRISQLDKMSSFIRTASYINYGIYAGTSVVTYFLINTQIFQATERIESKFDKIITKLDKLSKMENTDPWKSPCDIWEIPSISEHPFQVIAMAMTL